MAMKSTLNLRPAQSSDLEQITDIACSAFRGSPIYNHFSPHHYDFPVTFRRALRNEMRGRMASPGQVIMVAEAPTKDSELEFSKRQTAGESSKEFEVVGYCVWILRAVERIPEHWNPDSFMRKLARSMLFVEERISSLFSPDRTTSTETINFFHATAKDILRTKGVRQHIELNTLAVHPERQRIGIGALLMKWGLRRAEQNALRVVLEATEVGVGLYEKMGFKRVGAVRLEHKKVDGKLIDSLSVPVMLWNSNSDGIE